MVSNGFWHIVSVVKEQSPPVLQKGTSTAQGEYDERANMSTGDYRFPQASTGGTGGRGLKLLGEAVYRIDADVYCRCCRCLEGQPLLQRTPPFVLIPAPMPKARQSASPSRESTCD